MFYDRTDAGRRLGQRLAGLRDRGAVVLGLPRGGVVVAWEVARVLRAPLDVVVARKLASPAQPEYGFGAVAPGISVLDEQAVEALGLSPEQVAGITDRQVAELARREALYRAGREAPDLRGRSAVLVDDGLATGVTARAAVYAVRRRGPGQVVLAVPVAAPEAAEALAGEVDQFVCLATPPDFQAVGQWYEDFRQITDREVVELLARARRQEHSAAPASGQ